MLGFATGKRKLSYVQSVEDDSEWKSLESFAYICGPQIHELTTLFLGMLPLVQGIHWDTLILASVANQMKFWFTTIVDLQDLSNNV